jgi:hypothetical protein
VPKKKRKTRRGRYDALLFQHLEHVPGKLLTLHPDIVRDLIGRQSGVYALYKRNTLYYVGLASKLSSRLKAHLRDRHKNDWDNFSIYLTNNSKHMKEIESLLLQIAKPKGNRVGGKPSGSENLRRRLAKAVRTKLRHEANLLIGHKRKGGLLTRTARLKSDRSALTYLLPQGGRLKGERNGKTAFGVIKRDGQIRVKGVSYSSVSGAGKAAFGRSVNGWFYWKVERSPGNWVRLRDIKRAGVPVIRR